MLNDAILSRLAAPSPTADRRATERAPYRGELVVIWHHHPSSSARYRVVDWSNGGFRISCAMPMIDGMTGLAMRLLPEGKRIEKPVMVAWSKPDEAAEGYQVGLRYL